MLLKDKVLFLSGGSSGIGLACAKAYVEEGAFVVVVSNNQKELDVVKEQVDPDSHIALHCDVSKESDVKAAIDKSIAHFGKIDAVHNNAGIVTPTTMLHETTPEEWNRLMDVNLKSIYLTTRHAFDALKKSRGNILNTSSLVGEIGQELHAAYSATKGGINSLTKSMALDYAKYNIRVNSVCPAWVLTPAVKEWVSAQPDPVQTMEQVKQIHPLGFCPEGDVIADACVFLLSDKARFITGCNIPVSGGAELGYRR